MNELHNCIYSFFIWVDEIFLKTPLAYFVYITLGIATFATLVLGLGRR